MHFRRHLAAAGIAVFLAAQSFADESKPLHSTPLMAEESKMVIKLLEDVHYLNVPVTEQTFHKLITQFMGDLDDQRMFFLAGDEKAFQARFGPVIGRQLRTTGDLDAAFAIFSVYRERASQRVDWVLKALDGDFDFTIDETFPLNRDKDPWPATAEQADDLWRRRLKFELLPELLNDKTLADAKETVRKRYERMQRNLDEFEPADVQEVFLSTLTQLYDPHSTFFSAETLEDFSISMRLSLVGIGALLASEDGYCTIKELIPGGPAMLSGELHPNDRIVGVAQGRGESVDVIGMNLRKVVNMIRGAKGTPLTLTVIPGDAGDDSTRRAITLVRDVVQLNASRAKADVYEVPRSDGTTVPIGVIDVPSFYGAVDDDYDNAPPTSVSADVEELLGKLQAQGVKGIVLDLRRNGGGLLSEAVQLTGLFITKGPVVQVRSSAGQIELKPDSDPRVAYSGPLVVLTSRYSASASEIVAGALQNYGRAIIVGDRSTHGKGTVQAVLEMRSFLPRQMTSGGRAGAAKLTIQKFYLPNGSSTQNKGVIPDVSLPAIEDYLPIGENDLPNSLPWDEISPARFNGHEVDPGLRNMLRHESHERIDSMEEFGFLKERIDWLRDREEMKGVSLNLETRKALKTRDEAFRKEMNAEQTELASHDFQKQEVLLDSVEQSGDSAPTIEELDADAEKSEDDPPPFDVHLRETLRIMCDAIQVAPDPQEWLRSIPALASYQTTAPETTPK